MIADFSGGGASLSPADSLSRALNGHHNPARVRSQEANYTRKGRAPFICGNCEYYIDAPPRIPQAPDGGSRVNLQEDRGLGVCQKVYGPYPGGGVRAPDTCRFYSAREHRIPNEGGQ